VGADFDGVGDAFGEEAVCGDVGLGEEVCRKVSGVFMQI